MGGHFERCIFHSIFYFLSDVLGCDRGGGPLEDQVWAGQHLASPQQRGGASQVNRTWWWSNMKYSMDLIIVMYLLPVLSLQSSTKYAHNYKSFALAHYAYDECELFKRPLLLLINIDNGKIDLNGLSFCSACSIFMNLALLLLLHPSIKHRFRCR